jgi:hypothetical protein
MQQRARALLAKPAVEQQRYFGNLATQSSQRTIQPPRISRPGRFSIPERVSRTERGASMLGPELQAMLRSAVQSRVNRDEIQKIVQSVIERELPESWVKVVEGLHKEVHLKPAKTIRISRPRSLDFVWETKTKGAEQCV